MFIVFLLSERDNKMVLTISIIVILYCLLGCRLTV